MGSMDVKPLTPRMGSEVTGLDEVKATPESKHANGEA
jgi:hypothetical protein